MVDLPDNRSHELSHHIILGGQWLEASNEGNKTTSLSYAAFEFRLAIERLAVHYWAELKGEGRSQEDMRDIESFKRIEKKIYALAGNQLMINRHYEFIRYFLETLDIQIALPTPTIGKMAGHWHSCSELCHIIWTLAGNLESNGENAFKELTIIHQYLSNQVSGITAWPKLPKSDDPEYASLIEHFMSGEADLEDVRGYITKKGIWAKVVPPNGGPHEFVGRSIPPAASKPCRAGETRVSMPCEQLGTDHD